MMDMDIYQQQAWELALPSAQSMVYLIPGLAAEAGEVCGVYAKLHRDGMTKDYHDKLFKELGDTLWFIAGICSQMDWDLRDVATKNIEKLKDRQKRGVLSGSGDTR